MIVGICTVDLKLYESFCLKDKRRVVKSVIQKTKGKFNISIAEVANLDKWQLATIGFSTVSVDKSQVNKILNTVLNFLELQSDFEITNIEMELL